MVPSLGQKRDCKIYKRKEERKDDPIKKNALSADKQKQEKEKAKKTRQKKWPRGKQMQSRHMTIKKAEV